jgi:hypothetical protein
MAISPGSTTPAPKTIVDIALEINEMERTWHSVRQIALTLDARPTYEPHFTGFIVYEWDASSQVAAS